MSSPRIRLGTEHDAPALLAIYAPYVEHTAITFECEMPSKEAFAAKVRSIAATYPFLVCEEGSTICGYAYASEHSPRKAYQWGVETSIYIDRNYHSRGIGSAFYRVLLPLLRDLGYYTAYARITLPNEKSVRLHEVQGFTSVGVLHKTGYKLGAWHDVLYMEAFLAALPENPAHPQKMNPAAQGITALLEKNSRLIRP